MNTSFTIREMERAAAREPDKNKWPIPPKGMRWKTDGNGMPWLVADLADLHDKTPQKKFRKNSNYTKPKNRHRK